MKLRRVQSGNICQRVKQRHGPERMKQHLRCKARELARKIKRLGPGFVFQDYQEVLFFLNCRDFPYLHLYNPMTLTEFLEECGKLGLYETAFRTAKRVKQLPEAVPILCRNKAYVGRLLKCFCYQRNWELLYLFLKYGTFSKCIFTWLGNFFKTEMILNRNLQEDEEEVIACLFERTRWTTDILSYVARTSNVRLFQKLRFWKLSAADFVVNRHLLCLFALEFRLCKIRSMNARAQSQSHRFLTEVVKSGLMGIDNCFYVHKLSRRIIERCRVTGCVEVLRLLYKLGWAENGTLRNSLKLIKKKGFHIEQSSECGLSEHDLGLIQVEEYIKKAASTPRLLEDLCVTRVSQLVGCREDRAEAANKLGIGRHLTDRVLFNDVCRELETGMSTILDRKRDPPGLFYCYKPLEDFTDLLGQCCCEFKS